MAPTSQDDLKKLLAACRIAADRRRFQQLHRLLDVERFASFAAMEMLIAHWDAHTLHTNNYRLYHEPTSDKDGLHRAVGLDAVFFISTQRLVQPPYSKHCQRALFETTEGRQ